MKAYLCDSCAKQDKCTEQFMLRHVCNLMYITTPDGPLLGGPGNTPWTYKDWGMNVDVNCKNYVYNNTHELSSCATQIGPHKLRLDFTETQKRAKEFQTRQELAYLWRRRMRYEDEKSTRRSIDSDLLDEYGIGADDMGIGYLDM